MAAAPLRIPVVLWEGNAIPGRAVRAIARLADALAVSLRGGRPGARRAPASPMLRDRDADPRRRRRSTGRRPRARLDLPPDAPVDPDLRRLAGRPAVQRRGRRGAAAARRARSTSSTSPATTGYAAALAARERLPAEPARAATGRTRSCARTCSRRSSRRTSSSGGPAPRRWPRSPRSGSRRSSSRTPTPAGHQGANAEILADGGRGPDRRRRGVRRRRARRRDRHPVRRRRPGRRWPRRPAASAGRARRTRSPSCRSPCAERASRCRRAERRSTAIARGARPRDDGRPRMPRRPAPPFDAIAIGTAIQRRIGVKTSRDEPLGAVHDDAGRRSGRPVRDRPQHPRAAGDRPLRPVARDPAHAPRAGQRRRDRRRRHPRPRRPEPGRGLADRGRPLHRRVGPADGPRGDRDADGRPDRASSSGWRSRAPSAARSGPTPAPTTATSPAILESADVLLGRRDGGAPDRRGARLPLPRQPPEAPTRTRSSSRRRSASRRRTRRRSPRASTRSGAGAGSTSRSGSRRPARRSATRPATRPAG